ncbi:OmpA family protein [Hymenobacter busanensis]|uniref:OmpA family protein n=1 Tax=Hymenobacter busanensis TaxID=2607656 RepID=A0A7L4ZXY1_9BACT|nr:OmpA family protein [Hymenobacter busanensis]KAA9325546.1 OmpA family protein [Hymenobacter busanensis]QHJ07783.1 OmpA family protein [Hymenobacter busanensis]
MKTILLALLCCLPLVSQGQLYMLNRAVERAASRVAERKIEEAVDRKVAEKTADYYSTLLEEGRLMSHAIQFEEGTATLLADSQPFVKGIADALRRDPAMKLRIETHTLVAGDATANLRLSQRRADAVRAALITAGIEGTRLTVKGLGETQPLYTDPDDEYAPLNQRVEFVKL